MNPVYANIPDELKALKQWVCSRDKIPRTLFGGLASSTSPKDWATFAQCAAKPGDIGFVLTEGDPYCFIDLDHVRDPATGDVELWAKRIIFEANSYTELSRSGTGYHIVVRGKLAEGPKRKRRVEMYDTAKVFVMTGDYQFGVGDCFIRDYDVKLLQARLENLDPVEPAPVMHQSGEMTTGGSESEQDARLIGQIAGKLRTKDVAKIEREFARLHSQRYHERNKKKGRRSGMTYIGYSISNLVKTMTFRTAGMTGEKVK